MRRFFAATFAALLFAAAVPTFATAATTASPASPTTATYQVILSHHGKTIQTFPIQINAGQSKPFSLSTSQAYVKSVTSVTDRKGNETRSITPGVIKQSIAGVIRQGEHGTNLTIHTDFTGLETFQTADDSAMAIQIPSERQMDFDLNVTITEGDSVDLATNSMGVTITLKRLKNTIGPAAVASL